MEYKGGADNQVADCLSRLPLATEINSDFDSEPETVAAIFTSPCCQLFLLLSLLLKAPPALSSPNFVNILRTAGLQHLKPCLLMGFLTSQ